MGTVILRDNWNEHIVVEEETSAWLTGTLEDESGNVIIAPTAIRLTLMEATTRQVINNVQDQDVLSSFAAGILKHELVPDDNPIVLPTTEEGKFETHYAEVVWEYAGSTGKTTYEFLVERCFVPVP